VRRQRGDDLAGDLVDEVERELAPARRG